MISKERAIQVSAALPTDATLGEIVETLRHLEASADLSGGVEQALPEGGAWDLLQQAAGTVEMPADWTAEHDHYLYGTPKRSSAA